MKPHHKYSPEFRAEAAKLVLEQGLSQEGRPTALPTQGHLGQLGRCCEMLRPRGLPGSRAAAELNAENARLSKERQETRLERDILKRPPRTLPGSRCPVRVREVVATPLSRADALPRVDCLTQRFLLKTASEI